MVKSSTQGNNASCEKKSLPRDVKPKKDVIRFLVNYSKALEIKKLKNLPEMAMMKN